jgi:dephospho-CoA kinase
MERNQISEEEAMKKISSQMPIGIKLKKADITVDNSYSRGELEKRVTKDAIPSIYLRLGYIDKE